MTPEAVRRWQDTLVRLGWPLEIDGDYGPMTTRATGDFQGMATWLGPDNEFLTVDGMVGPNTTAVATRVLDSGRRLVAPNFSTVEFACACRFPWPDADRHTILALERGRAASGGSGVHVLSGHRTDAHNVAVGGAVGSHHTCHPSGTVKHSWCSTSAVDIGNWRALRWSEKFARDVMRVTGGLGMDGATGWVIHVDNGPFRRWFY